MATDGLVPDLTLLLALSPDEGLTRAMRRGGHDRMERAELAFHERVARAFEALHGARVAGGAPRGVDRSYWSTAPATSKPSSLACSPRSTRAGPRFSLCSPHALTCPVRRSRVELCARVGRLAGDARACRRAKLALGQRADVRTGLRSHRAPLRRHPRRLRAHHPDHRRVGERAARSS